MTLSEAIDEQARNWFASMKGKSFTQITFAVLAGEIIGYLAVTNSIAQIVMMMPVLYIGLWIANKYGNKKQTNDPMIQKQIEDLGAK